MVFDFIWFPVLCILQMQTGIPANQSLRVSDMDEDVEVETTFPSTTSSTTVMTFVLEVELEVVLKL